MRTQLNTLKDLVTNLINPATEPETLTLLIHEAERLPDDITANIFGLTDYGIRQYICWHQDMLTQQSDKLYDHLKHHPNLVVAKALVIIQRLLITLWQRFPEHFDNKLSLPKATAIRFSRRLEAIQQSTLQKLHNANIDDRLTDITLYPITRFISGTKFRRYCDHNFLVYYSAALKELDLTTNNHNTSEELCARLLTVNYNGIALMDYLTIKVKAELTDAKTKKEKELVLKSMGIWLNLIPVRSDIAFDQKFENLKAALLKWVTLEENALALTTDHSKATVTKKPLEKLNISVGILAYLTRLYNIHKLFVDRKHAEIVDHMVQTYCTKNTERMSRDSFYNCYKAPTIGVARALRKLLRAMLDDIDLFINTGEVRGHNIKAD